MSINNQKDIATLSPHLFWDTDKSKLDIHQSKAFIIQRVLEYGLLQDWRMINKTYGLEEIKKVAITFRTIDDVTLSFLCSILKLKKEEFRCYNLKQSALSF